MHRTATFIFQIAVATLVGVGVGPGRPARADAQCVDLFRAEKRPPLVDATWMAFAEADYRTMLVAIGAVGSPVPEFGVGRILYDQWKKNPGVGNGLLKIGFKVVEPSTENPGEIARFVFPETFSALVSKIQENQGANTFGLASYTSVPATSIPAALSPGTPSVTPGWFRLDQKNNGLRPQPESDLDFLQFAKALAQRHVPLWPGGQSMLGFLHDLVHITQYIDHPAVLSALQTFFSRYLSENWDQSPYFRQRAEIFNEISYILKPSMYDQVDTLMVSPKKAWGSLPQHVAHLRRALTDSPEATIEKVHRLTDAFDELFELHGGATRDFYNVEQNLNVESVAAYVELTRANPALGANSKPRPKGLHLEFLESLEGLRRQIKYVGKKLNEDSSTTENAEQMNHYLAYRVAQLEVAILTQRQLRFSQVGLIEDSMVPLGRDSKTKRYFQSFQPVGSLHRAIFVSSESEK